MSRMRITRIAFHRSLLGRLSLSSRPTVLRCQSTAQSAFQSWENANARKRPLFPKSSFIVFRSFASSPPTPDNDDSKNDNDQQHSTAATNKRELLNVWLGQLKSLPNLITVSRILSTPLISYFIISEHYDWALYGCFIAGVSDVLDGYIAKRYGMTTVLGTYLDPLADKILINVLSISLWYSDILPTPLICLWLARDVVLMVGSYMVVATKTKEGRFVVDPTSTPLKVEPTNISKLNTAFQFLTLGAGLLTPVYNIDPSILETLCWITGGTTIASAFSYVDGKALTASGNKIRDSVRDRAKRRRQARK